MKNMPVFVFRIIDVLHPFLQLSQPADPVRGYLWDHLLQHGAKFPILTQYFSGLNEGSEEGSDDLLVHCGTGQPVPRSPDNWTVY
jgi:hypothetical protein